MSSVSAVLRSKSQSLWSQLSRSSKPRLPWSSFTMESSVSSSHSHSRTTYRFHTTMLAWQTCATIWMTTTSIPVWAKTTISDQRMARRPEHNHLYWPHAAMTSTALWTCPYKSYSSSSLKWTRVHQVWPWLLGFKMNAKIWLWAPLYREAQLSTSTLYSQIGVTLRRSLVVARSATVVCLIRLTSALTTVAKLVIAKDWRGHSIEP